MFLRFYFIQFEDLSETLLSVWQELLVPPPTNTDIFLYWQEEEEG